MAATYPNRRCTCGFNRFRESKQRVEEEVERWMLFDSAVSGGFGSTPFGTFFGAGAGGTWGLFAGTFRAAVLNVTCENCNRRRSQTTLGGITPLGIYYEDGRVIVAAADVGRPVTCYSIRLDGPDGVVLEAPLSLLPGVPPPIIAPAPPTTAASPPPGAEIVDTLLVAELPDVPVTGPYLVTLIDRCCGCETPLVAFALEASTMIFSPFDADIGGAPVRWLRNQRVEADVAQPASSTRLSIPFDKCAAVLEYDPKSGVLPDAEGWTRVGTGPAGDWALVEGGALRLQTTSPNTNYWEKTVVLPVALQRIYAYGTVLGDIPAGAIGSGFDIQGLYRSGVIPYSGVRMTFRENMVHYTRLDTTAQLQLTLAEAPSEWVSMYGADRDAGDEVGGESNSSLETAQVLPPGTYGVDGVVGAVEIKARFGNTVGAPSLVCHTREIVVSGPGRFIRARFSGLAPVGSPTLRLYMISDTNASLSRKVRLLVKYGVGTGNLYGPLPSSVGATINMLSPNTVYEVPLSLTGLTQNQPFWFSVERDWAHGDDLLDATAHLVQATVRVA